MKNDILVGSNRTAGRAPPVSTREDRAYISSNLALRSKKSSKKSQRYVMAYLSPLGIATGNPGVSQPIPVPVPAETCTLGHRYGFSAGRVRVF